MLVQTIFSCQCVARSFFQCTEVKKWTGRREAWYSSKNSFYLFFLMAQTKGCGSSCEQESLCLQKGLESTTTCEEGGILGGIGIGSHNSSWGYTGKVINTHIKRTTLCQAAFNLLLGAEILHIKGIVWGSKMKYFEPGLWAISLSLWLSVHISV